MAAADAVENMQTQVALVAAVVMAANTNVNAKTAVKVAKYVLQETYVEVLGPKPN